MRDGAGGTARPPARRRAPARRRPRRGGRSSQSGPNSSAPRAKTPSGTSTGAAAPASAGGRCRPFTAHPLVDGMAPAARGSSFDRHAQRAGRRLEAGFRHMVGVAAGLAGDVQREQAVERQGAEKFLEQLGVHARPPCRARRRRPRRGTRGRRCRPRPRPAPRPSAPARGRSGGCRACRPAPAANARPSTMPTSSVVWWKSMCRSPLARTSRSNSACRASAVSMWSRKPMPVAISARPDAVEVEGEGNVGLGRGPGQADAARHGRSTSPKRPGAAIMAR